MNRIVAVARADRDVASVVGNGVFTRAAVNRGRGAAAFVDYHVTTTVVAGNQNGRAAVGYCVLFTSSTSYSRTFNGVAVIGVVILKINRNAT